MAQGAETDLVAPTTGRSHRTDKREAFKAAEGVLCAVVPPLVCVQGLTQELDCGLCTVYLEGGEVEVIDENDAPLSIRRTENALAPF